MSKPSDSLARSKALDPRCSFICEAPAGSGKTELLTQRVLTLLALVDKPENILAMTFTRKAAAEMRHRVISALKSSTQDEPEDDHKKLTWQLASQALKRNNNLNWDLLNNPNRLKVVTFDSFCSQLVRSMPLQSALSIDASISDWPQRLYREALKEFLHSLETDASWADELEYLLAHLDNNIAALEPLLLRIIERRDIWGPLWAKTSTSKNIRNIFEQHLADIVTDSIEQIVALIPEPDLKQFIELAGFAAANLGLQYSKDQELAKGKAKVSPILACHNIELEPESLYLGDENSMSMWLGLVELVLTKSGTWRAQANKTIGFPASKVKAEKILFEEKKQQFVCLLEKLKSLPGLLDLFQDVRAWPSLGYSEPEWKIIEALSQTLPILLAHLQLVFTQHKQVDYVEYSQRAIQALGDEQNPTDLALRLDYKIQHILVDEFQDTSHAQLELLKRLTAGWSMDDGRTLFCVGDVMQSIYSFRGANVGLFLYAKAYGIGDIALESLQLKTNFRSHKNIVEWINKRFSHAFPANEDITVGAVKFTVAEPHHRLDAQSLVTVNGFMGDIAEVEEADYIAHSIRAIKKQQPSWSIAVLLRQKNHGHEIVRSLKKCNLAFQALDLEPLYDNSAILDIVSLTRALLAFSDRIAWLSILRAPWCGLSLDELECLNPYPNVYQGLLSWQDYAHKLTESSRQNIERSAKVLKTTIDNRQRRGLRQWVEGAWLALGGLDCLQDELDKKNIERYFVALEHLDQSGDSLSTSQLDQAVDSLFAVSDPNADDSLQVMTMHKSKGLEFDVVFIPALHRTKKSPDPELLLWQERLSLHGEEQLIVAPLPARGSANNAIYDYLKFQRKKRETMEACRLFYVACTRAKQRLYLSAKLNLKDDKPASPPSSSLLSLLWSSSLIAELVINSPDGSGSDAVEQSALSSDNIAPCEKEHGEKKLGEQKQGSEIENGEVQGEKKGRVDHKNAIDNTQIAEEVSKPSSEVQLDLIDYHHQYLSRLPANWKPAVWSNNKLLDSYIPQGNFNNDSAIQSWHELRHIEDESLRLLGIVVHEVLQAKVECHTGFEPHRISDRLPFITMRLQHQGLSAEQLENLKSVLPEQLERIDNDQTLDEITQNARKVYTEFDLTVARAGEFRHRIIDLLVVNQDNTAIIVDYKTAQPKLNEPLPDFLQREKQSYFMIMKAYQACVEEMGYVVSRMALYFPLLGQWAWYDIPDSDGLPEQSTLF